MMRAVLYVARARPPPGLSLAVKGSLLGAARLGSVQSLRHCGVDRSSTAADKIAQDGNQQKQPQETAGLVKASKSAEGGDGSSAVAEPYGSQQKQPQEIAGLVKASESAEAVVESSMLQGKDPQEIAKAAAESARLGGQGTGRISKEAKLQRIIASTLAEEESHYEEPKEIAKLVEASAFKVEEQDGDVRVRLSRELQGKALRIEFQLMRRDFTGEEGKPCKATIFTVVQDDAVYHCNTLHGKEGERFEIARVWVHSSDFAHTLTSVPNAKRRRATVSKRTLARRLRVESKQNPLQSYWGRAFGSLNEVHRCALSESLREHGLSTDVCDIVDLMAADKEHREYVHWLKTMNAFLI